MFDFFFLEVGQTSRVAVVETFCTRLLTFDGAFQGKGRVCLTNKQAGPLTQATSVIDGYGVSL